MPAQEVVAVWQKLWPLQLLAPMQRPEAWSCSLAETFKGAIDSKVAAVAASATPDNFLDGFMIDIPQIIALVTRCAKSWLITRLNSNFIMTVPAA